MFEKLYTKSKQPFFLYAEELVDGSKCNQSVIYHFSDSIIFFLPFPFFNHCGYIYVLSSIEIRSARSSNWSAIFCCFFFLYIFITHFMESNTFFFSAFFFFLLFCVYTFIYPFLKT